MFHDNLDAYVQARIDQALHFHRGPDDWDEYRALKETASIRRDGLLGIHRLLIQEAAAAEPHNPFSINGDVNQPPTQPPSSNIQVRAIPDLHPIEAEQPAPPQRPAQSPPPPIEDPNE